MEVHLHALIITHFWSMRTREIERMNAGAARTLVLFNHLIRFAIDTSLIAVKLSLNLARKSEGERERRKCLHFDYTSCVFFTLYSLYFKSQFAGFVCVVHFLSVNGVHVYCRRKNGSFHLRHCRCQLLFGVSILCSGVHKNNDRKLKEWKVPSIVEELLRAFTPIDLIIGNGSVSQQT